MSTEAPPEGPISVPAQTICPIEPLRKFVVNKDGTPSMINFRKRKQKSAYVNCSGGCGSEHMLRAYWKDDEQMMDCLEKAWTYYLSVNPHPVEQTTAQVQEQLDDSESVDSKKYAPIENTIILKNEIELAPQEEVQTSKPIKTPETLLQEHLQGICLANTFIAARFNELVEGLTKVRKESKDNLASIKPHLWKLYNGDQKTVACPVCRNVLISQTSFSAGHIVPESKGGISDTRNLMPICESCNSFMQINHLFYYAWKRHRRVLWSFKEVQLNGIQLYYKSNALLE